MVKGDEGKSGVYKCKSGPIDQTPPTDNLKVNAPPRATFQKPILLESKNQFLHMKLVCFILLILKIYYDYENY